MVSWKHHAKVVNGQCPVGQGLLWCLPSAMNSSTVQIPAWLSFIVTLLTTTLILMPLSSPTLQRTTSSPFIKRKISQITVPYSGQTQSRRRFLHEDSVRRPGKNTASRSPKKKSPSTRYSESPSSMHAEDPNAQVLQHFAMNALSYSIHIKDPEFIPNYASSAQELDNLVHHSNVFLPLERRYLFGEDNDTKEKTPSELSPYAADASTSFLSHSRHSPHFPSNWRHLAKDDLIDSCCNLMMSIHRSPSTSKLVILYVLLQSSYLLQYFIHIGILHAINDWVKVHPVKYIVPWYFKILRQTKWESVQVDEEALELIIKRKRFKRSDPLCQTIFHIFRNRHQDDLLMATKAFSVLKRLLSAEELADWLGDDWKNLVKVGLQSKSHGRRLLANNVLHTLKKYHEADDWNMQHAIVNLAYENFDEEETLKAIENLANTARGSFEEVMLAGGFKLCFDNLQHSQQRIRNHVLLLLRILCENAPETFLIYPFNMDFVLKMAPYIHIHSDEPRNNIINALHIIASILRRPELNSQQRIQEFHMVHLQIAAQEVLQINFENYSDSVQDLIIGAATCLYHALQGSTERSSYALNRGMLERMVFYVNQMPNTVVCASLLSLIAPLCSSKLSTQVLFQESPSVANQVIEVLRQYMNHDHLPTRTAARTSLQRIAEILRVDTYKMYDEYTPSRATFRHMSVPDDVVERTRKVPGFVYTRPTSVRETAMYIRRLTLKENHIEDESNLLDTFRRADSGLAGRRPASAIIAQPKQITLSQQAKLAQRVHESAEATRLRDNTIQKKADFISSLLDNSRMERRQRLMSEKADTLGNSHKRPFSAGAARVRTREPILLTSASSPESPVRLSLGNRTTSPRALRPASASGATNLRIRDLKHSDTITTKRTTDAIDRSKSRYSCAEPLIVDNALFIDSPPFPEDITALEKKRQRLKREQQKDSKVKVTALEDIESIVVQKRSRNGYNQSQTQLLRLCNFCGNASFSVVYKCFTCALIFCSSDCRREAVNSFHTSCSKNKNGKEKPKSVFL